MDFMDMDMDTDWVSFSSLLGFLLGDKRLGILI